MMIPATQSVFSHSRFFIVPFARARNIWSDLMSDWISKEYSKLSQSFCYIELCGHSINPNKKHRPWLTLILEKSSCSCCDWYVISCHSLNIMVSTAKRKQHRPLFDGSENFQIKNSNYFVHISWKTCCGQSISSQIQSHSTNNVFNIWKYIGRCL